ncbi:MAG: extracellular solute-binding protein [bacterium]|nr:extracellular solute-binding protein [bacterium]
MRIATTVLFFAVLVLAQSAASETTLTWWQFWTDPTIRPVIASMVEEFEQANPDIKVELTDLTWSNGHEKIAIAFASGSGPDIVELGSDWIAQFAANNRLADISPDVAEELKEYDGWSMATYDDKIYGQPWILGTRVLFWNQDLLDRADLRDGFLPISWAHLDTASHRITDLGRDIYGWGSNTAEKHRLYKKFMPFFWSAGARVYTDSGGFCIVSSEPAVRALRFYKRLHDDCGYVANQRGIEDAFLDGKIGFIISGDWLLKRIEQEGHSLNFRTILIPGETQTEFKIGGRSFMGGEFLTINAASENKEAALKFVKFITSPENQLRFCKANKSANPSSKTAQSNDYFQNDPNLKTFIAQLNHAVHPPVDPDWVFIESELEKAVESVLFENAGPGAALLDARINIAKLKEK